MYIYYLYICIYIIYIYVYIYIHIHVFRPAQDSSVWLGLTSHISADAFFSLFTNVTNLHIQKYKVKSATMQKLPMRNIQNKLNIFKKFYLNELPNRYYTKIHEQSAIIETQIKP